MWKHHWASEKGEVRSKWDAHWWPKKKWKPDNIRMQSASVTGHARRPAWCAHFGSWSGRFTQSETYVHPPNDKNTASGFIQEKWKHTYTQRRHSYVHNIPKLETTCMPLNYGRHEQPVVYPYSKIPLTYRKEVLIRGPQKHDAKWRNPHTEERLLCGSIYMKFNNSWNQDKKKRIRREVAWRKAQPMSDQEVHEGSFREDRYVLYLDKRVGDKAYTFVQIPMQCGGGGWVLNVVHLLSVHSVYLNYTSTREIQWMNVPQTIVLHGKGWESLL